MKPFIPLSVPNIKGNEIQYVTDALEKEWVSTGGTYIDRFEKEIAVYVNVDSAVACQSGSAGLHLSLVLANVTREDMVIVPTLTFIAAVNPVKYLGAAPVFMDCDGSLCMDMDKLQRFCETECELKDEKLIHLETQKHVKAAIVVHVFGNMADMEKAVMIADKYHLILIEDATEALGSYYTKGDFAGRYAGTIGDIGVYSFNGNKIITTGGGGMMVTKDPVLSQRARYLSTQAKDDAVNFIHGDVGYNYRMTNLQAAVGVAQLEKLNDFIAVKKANYQRYEKGIQTLNGLRLLPFNQAIEPNYWFYSLYIEDLEKYSKKAIIKTLSENNIQSRPIWGLIHEQKPYQKDRTFDIEKAKDYHRRIVNLPCSSNLTAEEVDRVLETLSNIK
ncbi:LegC family aminotransferase [Eubacterium sp. 1001713B170207_170306_E7]|uniref:LegC family aminotransferase n=1 Tax=Eubacterium sp. 1001713B170207_170306_E7 TaxID=2787097 RepID=UPI00189B3160|nr:LegC family aminotransferase [Eubacterium sp. 1001713B170207_170306_E7]